MGCSAIFVILFSRQLSGHQVQQLQPLVVPLVGRRHDDCHSYKEDLTFREKMGQESELS